MLEVVADRYVYVVVLVLLSIGLYGMLAARNLVRKIIAMTIFQTAIYLFYIEGSVKIGATVPVIDPALGSDPEHYVNPLPHLLILTAIVVGVAVVGVALALLIRIHRAHGSLDEPEVVARLSGAVPLDPDEDETAPR
jgi:multicomponent Na+:H+ antiporter subunit C